MCQVNFARMKHVCREFGENFDMLTPESCDIKWQQQSATAWTGLFPILSRSNLPKLSHKFQEVFVMKAFIQMHHKQ